MGTPKLKYKLTQLIKVAVFIIVALGIVLGGATLLDDTRRLLIIPKTKITHGNIFDLANAAHGKYTV